MQTTEKLARFVVETGVERIPAEAVAAAKNSLLDTLGVAFAGTAEPAAAIITRLVTQLGGQPVASVVGSKLWTSSPHAAVESGAARQHQGTYVPRHRQVSRSPPGPAGWKRRDAGYLSPFRI